MKRFIKWIGGGVAVAGAVLAAFLTAANAQQGWAIYEERGAPVVLSAGQKTAAANWARSVWPSIVGANLNNIMCAQKLEIECDSGQRCVDGVCSACDREMDFKGHWQCSACESVTYTDDELIDAELAGQDLAASGERCHFADSGDLSLAPRDRGAVQLLPAQVATLETAARALGGLGASDIPTMIYMARTPEHPTHVTATVNRVATLPPAQYRIAKTKGDQPGGVARLIGRVE